MSDERSSRALKWLAHALGDLEAAQAEPGDWAPARTVAFHAQQAAEKALKAALIQAGEQPTTVRDLDDLRNRLPDGWRVKQTCPDLSRLTDYADASQYPNEIEPVSRTKASKAVQQAARIVRSIRTDFDRRGVSTAGLVPQ